MADVGFFGLDALAEGWFGADAQSLGWMGVEFLDVSSGNNLTGTTSLTAAASGTLTGTGVLTGTTAITFAPSGSLTGTGGVAGTLTISTALSGTMTGVGPVTGSTSLTYSPAGDLTGVGTLVGSATLTFSTSASASGIGELVGSSALTLVLTASPSGVGPLSGDAPVALALVGTLTVAGSVVLSLLPEGALSGVGEVAGSAITVFDLTGTLTSYTPPSSMTGATTLTLDLSATLIGLPVLTVDARYPLEIDIFPRDAEVPPVWPRDPMQVPILARVPMSVNNYRNILREIASNPTGDTAMSVAFIGLTSDFATFSPDAGITLALTGGYDTTGAGPGAYTKDAIATLALATAHPRFCFADATGVYWRLLPDDRNLIPVACGGVYGSGATPDYTTDARPGIQDAINYSEVIGAAGVRFDAASYSLWRTVRTATAPNDIHSDQTGLLLRTTVTQSFVSTLDQTVLYRRDTDGSAMGIAKFTTCTGSGGYYWRGGAIFTEGQSSPPDDVSENSLWLHNIMLDGGIYDSSEENNPYGAYMNSNGDGWDISDKPIWQSNDRYCGHIVLTGNSGARYFMGELIYGSGVGASIAQRRIYLGPDVDLGHTCGSCLNGNGQTLNVERCHLHNGFIGFEGWTGELGGYFKARISNTTRDSIQGGIPNFRPGSYYLKSRPTASIVPIGHVDLVLNNCAQFDIGSWIQGKIVSVDCYPQLGNGAAFPGGSQDVDIECITYCDQGNLNGGVAILGGASTTMTTDRVSVHLDCKRTDNGTTNNYTFTQAVYCYGSYGPNVAVWLGAVEGLNHAPLTPAGTVYDYPIKLLGYNFDTARAPYYYYDIEANNNATIDIKQYGNVIATQVTNNGSYNMNLPTTGVPAGYRLIVRDTSKNFVTNGAACRIPAGNFRNGGDCVIPPGYGYAEFEFDGQLWSIVTPPPRMTATATWDPASCSAGSSVSTTVTLVGSVVGDAVDASFSNSLQGMVLTAYVSAAGTVTAVLFNPTGSPIDLASGTLRVTV